MTGDNSLYLLLHRSQLSNWGLAIYSNKVFKCTANVDHFNDFIFMPLCTNRIFVQRHLTTQPLYLLTRAKSRLAAIKNAPQNTLPDGVVIHVSESLSDRRSVFVGRACRVTDPSAASKNTIVSYFLPFTKICRCLLGIFNYLILNDR